MNARCLLCHVAVAQVFASASVISSSIDYVLDSNHRLHRVAYTGSATVYYSYDQGGNRLSREVSVAIDLSSIRDQTVVNGIANSPIPCVVSKPNVSADTLVVSARSDNAALLPKSAFTFGGSGENRTLTITPPAGQTGIATVTVIVSDGSVAAATDFKVTVVPLNRPPVVVNDSVQRPAGMEVKVLAAKLLANDSDLDGDPLTLVSVSALSAKGATVSLAGPWVVYTSRPEDDATDSFTYNVSDGGGGTAEGTVTVTIQSPSQTEAVTVVGATVLPDGNRRVSFAGIPGLIYSIEASIDLENWTVIGTGTAGFKGVFTFDDLNATNFPVRFYRTIYL